MVARTRDKEPKQRRGAYAAADTKRVRATAIYWNERVAMLMCGRCDTSLTLADFASRQCSCGATLPKTKLPVDRVTYNLRRRLARLLGA